VKYSALYFAVAGTLLTAGSSFGSMIYNVAVLAESGQTIGGVTLGQYLGYAAIGNDGTVAFTNYGNSALFTVSGGNASLLARSGQQAGGYTLANIIGAPYVNGSGQVAYADYTSTYVQAVFEGTSLLAASPDPYHLIQVLRGFSNDGTALFDEGAGGGYYTVNTQYAQLSSAIPGQPQASLNNSDYALWSDGTSIYNTSGVVATTGSTIGGFTIGAICTNEYGSNNFALSDTGALAVCASYAGQTAIISSLGSISYLPSTPNAALYEGVDINSNGLVAYVLGAGVYTQYGEVLAAGTTVGGKTINGFENAGNTEFLNNSNDIIVEVDFTDGTSGLLELTPSGVPEPGTIGLMFLGAAVVGLTRRRRPVQSSE
jgi:PEP-CTERM motif-containing protein